MKKYILAIALILVLAQNTCSVSWPTFRGDYTRRGVSQQNSHYNISNTGLLWSYQTNGSVRSSPALYDLDGDKKLEIIVGSDDDTLYAINYLGEKIWSFKAGGNIRSSPTIEDITGDGVAEILFGSDDKKLYVLNSNGELMWTYNTSGAIKSSPLALDLDKNGGKEIVFSSEDTKVYCLNEYGAKIWEYDTTEMITSSPAAYDMDGDSKYEIIIGSEDNIVHILKHPPHKVWRYQTQGDISATPAIYASTVFVGSADDKLYRLSIGSIGEGITRRVKNESGYWITETISTTSLLHGMNYTTQNDILSSAAVDYLADGMPLTIAFGSNDKTLYIIYSNGTTYKKYSVNDKIESSPALCDLDGDGQKEIIFGVNDGSIFILNINGTSVFHYTTGGPVKSSPALSDLTGDGTVEFLIGSDDGRIYAFGDLRTSEIEKADRIYEKAIKYYVVGEINESRRYVESARRIYSNQNHMDGVIRCDNFIQEVKANNLYYEAKRLYNEKDLRNASETVAKAIEIYSQINEKIAKAESETLYRLIEADTYYLEAQYFRDIEQYDNASIYANAANKFYASINNTEGISKTERLAQIFKREGKAENYIEDALKAKQEKKYGQAGAYLEYARLAYELSLNYEEVDKTEKLIKTVEAESLYETALQQYNRTEYELAKDTLEEAIKIIEDINNTEADNIKRLYNKTTTVIEAKKEQEEADRYYFSAYYELSIQHATNAMTLYKRADNEDGYNQSQQTYAKADEALKKLEGEKTGGVISEDNIAAAIILALLAVIAWQTRAKREKKKREQQILQIPKVQRRNIHRFGHKVVLIPKKQEEQKSSQNNEAPHKKQEEQTQKTQTKKLKDMIQKILHKRKRPNVILVPRPGRYEED